MKKLFAFVALLGCLLSVCCAPKLAPPPPRAPVVTVKAPDFVELRMWRDLELVLHVDTAFTGAGLQAIENAAAKIRELTQGHARLTVTPDLDLDSVDALKGHVNAHHSLVIGVLSHFTIVTRFDDMIPHRGNILAVTIPMPDGAKHVYLILDRIEDDEFETVVAHELGHVIGLPDLEVFGAIMSGASIRGVAQPKDWTPADRKLCHEFEYCR